jgi:uncharacterized protein DUF4238
MAIGSHTIPRYYLEQFAQAPKRQKKPGKVWTYQRGKPTQQRSTASQGYQNGYFAYVRRDGTRDESFEEKLAFLETRCDDVLVSAKSDLFELNSLSHRNQLAFYIGLVFARSTVRRKFSEANWAKLQPRFSKLEFDEAYVRDAASHYSKIFGVDFTVEEIVRSIRRVAATFRDNDMMGNAFIGDLLFHAEVLKAELVPRPWQVWKSPAAIEFITSDNPVVTFVKMREDLWHPGHGYRQPGVMVAFPLAPTACLAIGAEGRAYQEVDSATVMRTNELVVKSCDRFVYSKSLSSSIEELVNTVSHTSIPGETAFVGKFPETQQIEDYLRRRIGIKKRSAKPE